LPESLEKIGVFVDASVEEIDSTVRAAALTGVQLHFDAAPELTARLRERFGPDLRILRVIHFDADATGEAAANMDDPNVDGVLVDSRTASAIGGTGVAFDWLTASTTLFRNMDSEKRRLVAAGGLNPENVAEAIATLWPWGVDVVSGVEAAPGRKDPAKVRVFISHARAIHRR